MEYNTTIPIYLQVVTAIKQDILKGKLSPGDRLPSGRDLALAYTINPNTAARVYQELEREALCFTRRGLGTFVTEDLTLISRIRTEMAEHLVSDFLKSMDQLGVPRAEVLQMIEKKEG